jgi:hypothetical protein
MSFLHSISSFFSKVFHSNPDWTHTASTTLTLAAPMVQTITILTAGDEYGAEVENVMSEVQRDLGQAAKLIADAHSGGQQAGVIPQLQTLLNSINGNLGGLLAAGHIKNQQTLKKVEVAVSALTGEVSAVLSVLPKNPVAK